MSACVLFFILSASVLYNEALGQNRLRQFSSRYPSLPSMQEIFLRRSISERQNRHRQLPSIYPLLSSTHEILLHNFFSEQHCPKGWMKHGCFCYYMSSDKAYWYDAVEKCKQQDSHLVTIHSYKENMFLRKVARLSGVKQIQIGLHDQHKENDFQWIDGSSVTYINWKPNEPNNAPENCGGIYRKKWFDDGCSWRKTFVCKTPAEYEECGNGWELYNKSSCFYVSDTKLNWTEAKEYCHKIDGHLASIESQEEDDFINALINEVSWIGLTRRDHGRWVWEENFKNLTFTNWGETEPNGDEDCVELDPYDGKWNDVSCGRRDPYICKKAINNPTFSELIILVNDNAAKVFIEWEEETEIDCPKLKVKAEKLDNHPEVECGSWFDAFSNTTTTMQYAEGDVSPFVLYQKRFISNFALGPLESCTAYNVTFMWLNESILHSAVIVTSSEKQRTTERFSSNVRYQGNNFGNDAVSMVWWGVFLLSICLFLLGVSVGYMMPRMIPKLNNYKNIFPLNEIRESSNESLKD